MEILVASTCSVIAMGGALSLFVILTRLFSDGSLQMRIQSQARYGIEHIARHVRAAEFITVQANGDRMDITVPATNLRANISSSATAIPVDSVSFLPGSGIAYIGNESVGYRGSTAPGDAGHPSLLNCTRGYAGTTATAHDDDDVLIIKPTYYLNGGKIYVDNNGVLNTASDDVVISNTEKISGVSLFQYLPVGTSSYKTDRVQVAFRCFQDRDKDHVRDVNEPGVDFSVEFFTRNR